MRARIQRSLLAAIGAVLAFVSSIEPASAQAAWTVPSNREIHELLAERMRHNGVGIVVGIIEPSGELSFEADAAGRFSGLTHRQKGKEQTARRL